MKERRMKKTLVEMVEEASRRPVPYNGLAALYENSNESDGLPQSSTTAENPRHAEDFNRLLTSVATGKPRDDQT